MNLGNSSLKVMLFMFLSVLCTTTFAQSYKRSALSLILLEGESFPDYDTVMMSWNNYPFPDKYDNHSVGVSSINIDNTVLTDEDMYAAGYLRDTFKGLQQLKVIAKGDNLRYITDDSLLAYSIPGELRSVSLKIEREMKNQKLAHKYVAKWWDLADSGFSTSLLMDRSKYNISANDAALNNTGEIKDNFVLNQSLDLLTSSFLTISNLSFMENEPVARAIRDAAIESINSDAEMNPTAKEFAIKAANALYEKTKEGYTTVSKTFLFKLTWNDSIQNLFFTNFYTDKNNFDPSKIEGFWNSDLFQFEFVGSQINTSISTFKIGTTQTKGQLIDKALVRNLDNTFSKLQKNYEDFRPFTPISTLDPITASIGMKEGLEGGETFGVWGFKNGKYVEIGEIKVDKKNVWDNRYSLLGENADNETIGPDGLPLRVTYFKGKVKDAQPGYLIKFKKD